MCQLHAFALHQTVLLNYNTQNEKHLKPTQDQYKTAQINTPTPPSASCLAGFRCWSDMGHVSRLTHRVVSQTDDLPRLMKFTGANVRCEVVACNHGRFNKLLNVKKNALAIP